MARAAIILAAALLAALPGVPRAQPEGDAEAGRSLFTKNCNGCHALSTDLNHYAPNLHCVLGRKAGTAPFPAYTEGMRALAAAGLVWDAASLSAFLAEPLGFVRAYLGRPDAATLMQVQVVAETDRANLIAYLDSRCR